MNTYPLRYVCKYCAAEVAVFPHTLSSSPATMSYCDRDDCRAKASAEYKRPLRVKS